MCSTVTAAGNASRNTRAAWMDAEYSPRGDTLM